MKAKQQAHRLVQEAIQAAGIYPAGSTAYVLCVQGNLQSAIEGLIASTEAPDAQSGCTMVAVPFGNGTAHCEMEDQDGVPVLLNVFVRGVDITEGLCDSTKERLDELATESLMAEAVESRICAHQGRRELAEVH